MSNKDVPEKIRGRVAQILNARELVINRGSDQGIQVGMKLAVLNSRGVDIQDPDTGEVIGSVDVPKVLVKVVRVSEKVAVASTFRTFKTGGGGFSNLNIIAEMYREPETKVETLRTSESTYKEEINPEDSYVQIGDPVIQVVGDEFSGWGMGAE